MKRSGIGSMLLVSLASLAVASLAIAQVVYVATYEAGGIRPDDVADVFRATQTSVSAVIAGDQNVHMAMNYLQQIADQIKSA